MFRENQYVCPHVLPLSLNWTDNMVSKAWISKAASKTNQGKLLQRLSYSLTSHVPVGLIVEYIAGVRNKISDAIHVHTHLRF